MNALQNYKESAISTQSRGKIIVMLYDGAIKFLRQAQDCMRQGDWAGKNRYIGRARDIVFELNTTLNMEVGGSVAQNLRSLYNFIWRYLADANIKNDPQMIEKVIGMLTELGGAWRKIAE